MTDKTKIFILGTLLVTILFFAPHGTAHAIIQQPIQDTTSSVSGGIDNMAIEIHPSTTTTIDKIEKWQDYWNITDFAWALYSSTTQQTAYDRTKLTYIDGDANGVACGTPCIVDIPNQTLSPGIYYYLTTWRRFQDPVGEMFAAGINSPYPIRSWKNGAWSTSTQWTFRLYEPQDITGAIIQTYPMEGTILNTQPVAFRLTYSGFAYASTSEYKMITYYSTPEEPTLYDLQSSGWGFAPDGTAYTMIDQQLFKPEFGTSTKWMAHTELWHRDPGTFTETLIYTTTNFRFTITKPFATSSAFSNNEYHEILGRRTDANGYLIDRYGNYVDLTGTITSTPILAPTTTQSSFEISSDPFFVDCSPYSGGLFSSSTLQALGCYVNKTANKILGLLIMPPKFMTDMLHGAVEQAKTSFPFSMIYGVIGSVEFSATSTLGTATSSALEFPIPGHGTYVVLTSSTLENAVGTDLKNKIFDAINHVIWIGTGVIIFTLFI